MFDSVRNNKRIVQIFLIIITIPFALWGVEAYVNSPTGGDAVATVGRAKVTQDDFQRELRNQEENLRRRMGADFDPKMLDNPEARVAVIDGLINNRLLSQATAKAGFAVSDEAVAQVIQTAPVFQDGGKFSRELYQAFVRNQNLSEAQFEERLRADLAQQQWLSAIGESLVVSTSASARWAMAVTEERDVSVAELNPEAFIKDVKLAPDAARKFYDTNPKHYETPERVRAEVVVLSAEQFMKQHVVSDADIKASYDSHQSRYSTPEQRRASHILIAVDAGATPEAVKAAQTKAEDLLKRITAQPQDFAKLAREFSQDPGSKEQGGDLGAFGRGAMVKPFEEAVFSLKENELSKLVRTDYGFHIIKLTGITPPKVRALAEVKAEIADELKRQTSAKLYADAVEGFNNMVFEQADTLKPVSDKYKLALIQTDWVNRGAKNVGPLASEKLVAALFSDDAVKNKRNTEVIDLGNNALAAARVLEHKNAAMRPFDEVKAEIEAKLTREEAGRLAQKAGEAAVAGLQKEGKAGADLKWQDGTKVSRASARSLPKELAQALFGLSRDKLPSYGGLAAPDGRYLVLRLNTINKPQGAEAARLAALNRQYQRTLAEDDLASYIQTLRGESEVKINQAVLVTKDR